MKLEMKQVFTKDKDKGGGSGVYVSGLPFLSYSASGDEANLGIWMNGWTDGT